MSRKEGEEVTYIEVAVEVRVVPEGRDGEDTAVVKRMRREIGDNPRFFSAETLRTSLEMSNKVYDILSSQYGHAE